MNALVTSAIESAERKLLAELPNSVRRLLPDEPIYCVFILYDDGSSVRFTPHLQIGPKSLLDACEAGFVDGIGDKSEPYKAFAPQQNISSPFPGFPCPGCDLELIAQETSVCYEHGIINDGPPGLPPRDPIPPDFRQMLYRVALQMNDQNAFADVPTTEHFFVLASDYTSHELIGDIQRCVSPDKYDRLLAAYPSLRPYTG